MSLEEKIDKLQKTIDKFNDIGWKDVKKLLPPTGKILLLAGIRDGEIFYDTGLYSKEEKHPGFYGLRCYQRYNLVTHWMEFDELSHSEMNI